MKSFKEFLYEAKDKSGNIFVKKKMPGMGMNDSDKVFIAKVNKALDKFSLEFAGVTISDVFYGADRNFRLNGEWYFKGSDGDIYSWAGSNTENPSGFSVVLTKFNPENSAKVAKKDILK